MTKQIPNRLYLSQEAQTSDTPINPMSATKGLESDKPLQRYKISHATFQLKFSKLKTASLTSFQEPQMLWKSQVWTAVLS